MILDKQRIIEGQELKLSNLVSYRGEVLATELQHKIIEMKQIIESSGANFRDLIVTATFNIRVEDNQQKIDIEILLPIEESYIELEREYKFKKDFHLVNGLYVKHEGSPNDLQETYSQVDHYLKIKSLDRITAAYNVHNQKTSTIEVYLGINPSIL